MTDTKSPPIRTVRELGGEIWAELFHMENMPWQAQDAVVDVIMGVLARHAGCVLENDTDLPVTPLPRREGA